MSKAKLKCEKGIWMVVDKDGNNIANKWTLPYIFSTEDGAREWAKFMKINLEDDDGERDSVPVNEGS